MWTPVNKTRGQSKAKQGPASLSATRYRVLHEEEGGPTDHIGCLAASHSCCPDSSKTLLQQGSNASSGVPGKGFSCTVSAALPVLNPLHSLAFVSPPAAVRLAVCSVASGYNRTGTAMYSETSTRPALPTCTNHTALCFLVQRLVRRKKGPHGGLPARTASVSAAGSRSAALVPLVCTASTRQRVGTSIITRLLGSAWYEREYSVSPSPYYDGTVRRRGAPLSIEAPPGLKRQCR